jgi:hypothetical protein
MSGCGTNGSGQSQFNAAQNQSASNNSSSTQGTTTQTQQNGTQTDPSGGQPGETQNSGGQSDPAPGGGVPSDPPPGGGDSGTGKDSIWPAPPASAVVFAHIEQMDNWGSCNTPGCSGGSGKGEFWMARNQSTPSLDGNSVEFHNSGVWGDALWWSKLGEQDNATNFLWDFHFRVEDAATNAAQALEFDAFQFREGYNYMMGSQCNYAAGVWDVWDEANGKWVHSKIACPKFSPGTWHHVQWYMQRVAGSPQYTFVTLVVDGVAYAVNQTYSAKNVGWSKNVGVQYQLDVNSSGAGYEMWVDRSTLTLW